MMTHYRSCPRTPRRSWLPSDGRSRLLKWLAGVLTELGVDRRAHVANGDGGFTWMMEPSKLSRGVARCKCLFRAHQLSVFFAPARYREVKIVCFCSEVNYEELKRTL
jgi:hypothetical protein